LNEESRVLMNDLSANVDFEALSKLAFGKRWPTFPTAQRQEFLKTLQNLLENVVYPEARKITAKTENLKFTEGATPTEVKVSGRLERERNGDLVISELNLSFLYTKGGKITDAVIEGERLSANLKKQFDAALKKQKFSDIIAKMKKRAEDARQKNS